MAVVYKQLFFLILFSASRTFFLLQLIVGKCFCLLLAIEKKLLNSCQELDARADAVACLHESYDEIKKALEPFIKNRSQIKEIQNEAQNLIKKKNTFYDSFVERHSLSF